MDGDYTDRNRRPWRYVNPGGQDVDLTIDLEWRNERRIKGWRVLAVRIGDEHQDQTTLL